MLNVLKEYLVAIGFKADMTSYNQVQDVMRGAEKAVASFTSTSITQFAAAGAGVTAFFAITSVGIAKFIGDLAQADLENQKFARQMWINQEYAKAYTASLNAMGASLQDLYYSPELLQNFYKLREQAYNMRPPDEYKDQMKSVRQVSFEFQKMKLEASYSLQWVGYYLYKYLEEPITQFKKYLSDVNKSLDDGAPSWTKRIAQVVGWFARLDIAAIKAGAAIVKLFRSIPDELQVAGGAMLGGMALLKMGPIGWIITGLTTILLLLDDFYTYQSGGESALPDLWKWVEDFKETISDNGDLVQFKTDLQDVATAAKDVATSFGDLLGKISGPKGMDSIIKNSLLDAFERLDGLLRSIAGSLELIDGIVGLNGDKTNEGLDKTVSGINRALLGKKGGAAMDTFLDRFDKWLQTPINPPGSMSNFYGYMYPPGKNTSNSIKMESNFNIYEASDPLTTSKIVAQNQRDMMIRTFQGVTQ